VPLLKLIALGEILIAVTRKSVRQPQQRSRLFRIVEYVGRWSMLDVFAMSLLVTLVQVQSLATVQSGRPRWPLRGWSCSPCSPPSRSTSGCCGWRIRWLTTRLLPKASCRRPYPMRAGGCACLMFGSCRSLWSSRAYSCRSEKLAEGTSIEITFHTADDLEPNKTKISYKAVEIGEVKEIHVSKTARR